MTRPDRTDVAAVAKGLIPAINAVEQRCTDAVMAIIPAGHKGGPIGCNQSEWDQQSDAFEARDTFYATMMPNERSAIRVMAAAFERLKALGWREAIYCPKDGSTFDAIEPGSTGIHSTAYFGDWPEGGWLVDGDWPSRPCLYRPTQAELAQREQAAARFRAHLIAQEQSHG